MNNDEFWADMNKRLKKIMNPDVIIIYFPNWSQEVMVNWLCARGLFYYRRIDLNTYRVILPLTPE